MGGEILNAKFSGVPGLANATYPPQLPLSARVNLIRFAILVGSLLYLGDLRVRDGTQHFKRRTSRQLRKKACGVLARQQDAQSTYSGQLGLVGRAPWPTPEDADSRHRLYADNCGPDAPQ